MSKSKDKKRASRTPLNASFISPADVVSDVMAIEAASGTLLERKLRILTAALSVFRRFFGQEWIDTRILTEKRKRGAFIHPAIASPMDEFKMGDRIISLAEHLVNLQDIDGFASCLKEIHTDKLEPVSPS